MRLGGGEVGWGGVDGGEAALSSTRAWPGSTAPLFNLELYLFTGGRMFEKQLLKRYEVST